jgi:tetratricopeptide (TPR) repeat protein
MAPPQPHKRPQPSLPGAAPGVARKLSPRKLWLFRLGAILLPLLGLGMLELSCRALGLGPDVRLVRKISRPTTGMTHHLNGTVDLAYYGGTDLLGPEPRAFVLPKPPGTFRIVFLGASTVIGFPYAPEVAFPRHVEVQLRQQNPDRQFEVLNLGITAINSFALVDLLRQSLACEPDLIVVHAGHNEFYGPGGPASTAGRVPYALIHPLFALRRLRLVQLAELGNPFRQGMRDDLLDTLPTTLEIPLDGPVFRQAAENYRRNIQQMVDLAQRGGVPILLSTVACNLRDQSPMRSLWPAGSTLSQQARWERLLRQGETLLAQGDHAAALAALMDVEQELPGHARLTYRTAQCLEGLGRSDEALAAYRQARDEDACRFRAPSAFADIVKQVAARSAAARLLDVERLLAADSTPAGPGYDRFLEHVHYSYAGHVALGRIFARGIQEQILSQSWSTERDPSLHELENLVGLVPEDHLAAYSSMIEVLQTGPLKSALDATRHEAYITERIRESYHALDAPRRDAFADIPTNIMLSDLIGALAYIHQVRGNADLSEKFQRLIAVRRPWTVRRSGDP